eukprot:1161862-Pelagomonas_calceolata.AAC.5
MCLHTHRLVAWGVPPGSMDYDRWAVLHGDGMAVLMLALGAVLAYVTCHPGIKGCHGNEGALVPLFDWGTAV